MKIRTLVATLSAGVALLVAASCGSDDEATPDVNGSGPIPMTVVNQVPIPSPCMGPSLTFFEGTTPVDIPSGGQKTVQVSNLFGAYQIGFQVNGWYWRTCTSPGNCPNPKGCQNPDNAGQVAIEIASDCSSAKLVSFTSFTCDDMVPNAIDAVSVKLQSANPCTVVVEPTSSVLTPTDQCCSCSSCSGSQIPAGQVPHCQ
ncbi:MAG TPA: hypothetical protein VIS07_18075 [Candidatus Binatia bacterium]